MGIDMGKRRPGEKAGFDRKLFSKAYSPVPSKTNDEDKHTKLCKTSDSQEIFNLRDEESQVARKDAHIAK